MAVRFNPETKVKKELARLWRAELAKAIGALETADRRGKSLHEARKAIKRTRALLCLGKAALGKTGRAENKRLGEAGRLLSVYRDRDVQARLLARECGDGRPRRVVAADDTDRAEAVGKARRKLRQAQKRLEQARVEPFGLDEARDALRKSYRRARRQARESGAGVLSDNALHDWRKAVKTLLLQVQLTGRWGGAPWQDYRKRLSALDDALGDARDLRRLDPGGGRANRVAETKATAADRRCQARLKRRAAEELARARRLAKELFKAKPRAFIRAMISAHD